jgi:outer membrane protein
MVGKRRTIHRFDGPGHGRYSDALVRSRALGPWTGICGGVLLAASAAAQVPPAEPPPLPADPVLEAAAAPSGQDLLEDAVQPAAGAPTLTLARAVAAALENNFALLQAVDTLASSRYRYTAALAQFYPKLTPSYQRSSVGPAVAVEAGQRLPWTGGSVTARMNLHSLDPTDSPFTRYSNFSFTLTQPLLRGFGPNASLYDLRNSRRDREGRERDLELERQGLAVEVARAFYQVIEQRTLLAVARQSLQRSQNLQRASEARLEVGLVSKLDVFRAQLQASQAEEAMVRAESALQDALERFRFLLGVDPSEPVEPAAVALSLELPPGPSAPLAVLVQRALAARLDLAEARDKVEDAQRGASLARQNLLPQLDLNLGVNKEGFGNSFSSAWSAGDQRVNLYFSASYPIERAGNLVNKALADIAVNGVRRTLRQRELEVETQVRAAVRELDQLRKSMELQKQGVDVAQQQLRLATLRYQRGLASNFDVVDAESSLVLARSALVGLLTRYQIARVELLRTTGDLDVARDFEQ